MIAIVLGGFECNLSPMCHCIQNLQECQTLALYTMFVA